MMSAPSALAAGRQVTLTISPVEGATGSVTLRGVRTAGHAATAARGDVPGAPRAAAPATLSGQPSAREGCAQPSGRIKHEPGGGVGVGVDVAVSVEAADEDGVVECAPDADEAAVEDGVEVGAPDAVALAVAVGAALALAAALADAAHEGADASPGAVH